MIDQLYEQYEIPLKRYAYSLCKDHDQADDLVQETFVKALTNQELLNLMEGNHKKNWLYMTLRNHFIDKKRKEQKETNLPEHLTIQDDRNDYEDIENRETADQILRALPQHLQTIVFKKYYMRKTSVEIAREESIPDSTVRYYLAQAKKIARQTLEKE